MIVFMLVLRLHCPLYCWSTGDVGQLFQLVVYGQSSQECPGNYVGILLQQKASDTVKHNRVLATRYSSASFLPKQNTRV